MKNYKSIIITIFIFVISYSPLACANKIQLIDLPNINISSTIFIDESGNETFLQITNENFIDVDLKAKFTNKCVFWIRFDITSPFYLKDYAAILQVLPSNIEKIQLYMPDGSIQFAGIGIPASLHTPPVNFLSSFKINLNPGKTRFYIRIENTGVYLANFKLFSQQAFENNLITKTFLLGIFYGLILLIFIINIFNYIWTRDSLYISYVIFLFFTWLTSFSYNGYLSILLGNHANIAIYMDQISWCAMMLSGPYFAIYIFRIDQLYPKIENVIRQFNKFTIPCILLIFSPFYQDFLTYLTFYFFTYGLVLFFISSYNFIRFRDHQMMILFFAYAIFFTFQCITIFMFIGIIPISEFSLNSWQIGTLAHLLLLHLTIMVKFREQQYNAKVQADKAQLAIINADEERRQRSELLQFLSMLSHEINTPLTVIDSTIQSLELLNDLNNTDCSGRYTRIRNSVKRLHLLFKESLARERIMSGIWDLHPQSWSMYELIEDVISYHGLALPTQFEEITFPLNIGNQSAGNLKIICESNLPDKSIADLYLLKIALSNLLDNACKYAYPESTVVIEVYFDRHTSLYHINVISQGDQMSSSELEKVFNKYWRRSENKNVVGAGLGLYLVRHIAILHKGYANAVNLENNKTCFSIHFPLRENLQ
jgi:signal transduction histidine kinase